MRKVIVVFLWSVIICDGHLALAQSSLAILDSVRKHYAIERQTLCYQYRVTGFQKGEWQSYYPGRRERSPFSQEMRLDLRRRLFSIDAQTEFPGGYKFRTVLLGNDTVAYTFDINQNRFGKEVRTGNPAAVDAGITNIKDDLPFLYLIDIEEENLITETHDALHGLIQLRINTPANGLSLFVDPRTNYITRIERIAPSFPGVVLQSIRYSDYKKVDGVPIATSIAIYENDRLVQKRAIAGMEVNKKELEYPRWPENYRVSSGARGPLVASKVGNFTYLIAGIPGDRNTVFVDMGNYVVVMESPLNDEFELRVIRLIKETLPGKPIRYLFLTHFHNDHISGVRSFVAEGATIIVSNPTKKMVSRLLNITFSKDSPGTSVQQKVSYATYRRHFRLKNEECAIDFWSVRNSHARGLSFASVPTERFVYQGDLLSIPADGTLTPPIDVNIQFYHFLKRKKISFERMVSHHGHNFITPSMISFN
ncbi:MAG: MBL fold metallo-hydrolase [Bacteroidetes bacterium]|nr:MBL fold metallo-hydrolase [Bacteroidota bacterium]